MNKTRLAAIHALQPRLNQLCEALEDAHALLDRFATLRDEEQEYYENIPELLQNGEQGERSQAALEVLNEIINELDELTGIDQSSLNVEDIE